MERSAWFICTQTGGESIAESCLHTNTPRAQDIFHRGQQQHHHGVLRITETMQCSNFKRGWDERVQLGTRKLKVENTGGGGGGRTENVTIDPQFG